MLAVILLQIMWELFFKIYRIIYCTEFLSALIVENLRFSVINSNIEAYDRFNYETFLQIYVSKFERLFIKVIQYSIFEDFSKKCRH